MYCQVSSLYLKGMYCQVSSLYLKGMYCQVSSLYLKGMYCQVYFVHVFVLLFLLSGGTKSKAEPQGHHGF